MSTSDADQPTKVFKILTLDQWVDWVSSDVFKGAGIDIKDGYIHLSTSEQVVETYNKYFHGQKDIVLVGIDLNKVTDQIKWEPSRNGQLFAHVYGSIDKAAVISHVEGWQGTTPEA